MDTSNLNPEQQRQVKKAQITMWLALGLIVLIGLGVAVYFIFIKEPAPDSPVPSTVNTNSLGMANVNMEGEEGVCEVGVEYEHTAVAPISCECPDGYVFEEVSVDWGPCPEEGMTDCIMTTQKCVEGSDSTPEDWIEYSDPVEGYTAYYPDNYLIKGESDGYVVFDHEDIDSPDLSPYYVSITVKDTDFHTYRLGILTDPATDSESVVEEDYTLNGITGKKITYQNALGETIHHFIASYLGKVYDITAPDSVEKGTVLSGILGRFEIAQLDDSVDIADASAFEEKECVSNNECGAYPCHEGSCYIQECESDASCLAGVCGQYTTPIPGYCTMMDAL